jgi:uncharacterized protein (DUF433 family)
MLALEQNALEVPNYGLFEAAKFFHIPASTVSYWAHEERLVKAAAPRGLSFKNMVEFYVIKGLRELHHVSPHEIRRAIRYMRKKRDSKHPFADYRIVTDGKWVLFYDEDEQLENASLAGQFEMETVVRTYLHRVDRTPTGLATRIFPYTRKEQLRAETDPPRLVVIDPNIRSGLPVINGSRLTTSILASRMQGGDSVSVLAKSYGRSTTEIKEAVEWELGRELTGVEAA